MQTIRRKDKSSPRQPVQQLHVDQTPGAAEARVRRHLPPTEAEELLKKRYQLINVWRPIANPATDFPLAVVDWRTTSPKDFIKVDLLYPKRQAENGEHADDDDRGKETLPDPTSETSTTGYEIKGETFAVAPNDNHKFFYYKDMTTEEAMLIKCFDSLGEGLPTGQKGIARCTPHTLVHPVQIYCEYLLNWYSAFIDPQTPEDAPGRQSIEVRCLVFYE